MNQTSSRPQILLIDDDRSVIKLVEALLTSHGFDVVAQNEAPAGLEFAMKQKTDLIILDVMMPIINGYNICRMMKSRQGREHIPIILLTSRSGDDDLKIGTEVGADAYIPKPFDRETLLSKVKELLGMTS